MTETEAILSHSIELLEEQIAELRAELATKVRHLAAADAEIRGLRAGKTDAEIFGDGT